MKFNFQLTAHILSILVLLNGVFMLLCLPFSIYYHEDITPFLLSSALALAVGGIGFFLTWHARNSELYRRDGYLVVTTGWIVMSCFGCMPYYLSGSIPTFTNAFFETVSGYSTTGASILTDIEAMPRSMLFWRSLTQWIGGMGIIVLAVAILPILGIGGMKLFVAEAPGISADKLQPRIKETAKRLWYIYLGLTLTEMLLLHLAGMSFYDAINHALTTMATGGFSTRNASIGAYQNPMIQYVIILFMFFAGTNFAVLYFLLNRQVKRVIQNGEFVSYLAITASIALVVALVLFFSIGYGAEKSLRTALFQVVSIITTTGYATDNYLQWGPFLGTLFFFLLFTGASAGSTAGGLKLVRILILFKNALLGLKRELHPSAVIPLRINGQTLKTSILYNVLGFMIVYVTVFNLGTLILSAMGIDFQTALGATITCISNVGPGIGSVGPSSNFAHLPIASKWLLSFLMLVGRLELFTILIILTPYFWKRYF